MLTNAKQWMIDNAHKLPRMDHGTRIGRKNISYGGSINDLAKLVDGSDPGTIHCNPRRGSDVYSKNLCFNIETIQTQLSEIPGAPTFPVKQWLRYKPAQA